MKEGSRYKSLNEIAFSNYKDSPWPCYVSPAKGELISSWITRIARSHLVRFYSFCSSNFVACEFWHRDLDRNLPDSMRRKILSKCQLNDLQINEMLLQSYYPFLSLSIQESRSYWITQLNFYTSSRKHFYGLAVCPSCLKKDGENPFYRKVWRLALSTVCVTCGADLIDACPQCGSPINFLLSERGKKYQAPLFPITSCWKCLYPLSDATIVTASESSLKIQKNLFDYLDNGFVRSGGIQYSHLYFDVLKKIISLLNKQGKDSLAEMQRLICKETNQPYHTPEDNRVHPFNTYRIDVRRDLLQKAFWLLDNWPERFRRVTKECGLRSKYFLDDFANAPFWFKSEILENNTVTFAPWRKSHPDFSYSSFKEFSTWQESKAKKGKSVARNSRKRY